MWGFNRIRTHYLHDIPVWCSTSWATCMKPCWKQVKSKCFSGVSVQLLKLLHRSLLLLVFFIHSSYIWFISLNHSLHITGSSYNFMSLLINLLPKRLHSSVGRASHRYHTGHGFKSRWSLRVVFATTYKVAKITFTSMVNIVNKYPNFKFSVSISHTPVMHRMKVTFWAGWSYVVISQGIWTPEQGADISSSGIKTSGKHGVLLQRHGTFHGKNFMMKNRPATIHRCTGTSWYFLSRYKYRISNKLSQYLWYIYICINKHGKALSSISAHPLLAF